MVGVATTRKSTTAGGVVYKRTIAMGKDEKEDDKLSTTTLSSRVGMSQPVKRHHHY